MTIGERIKNRRIGLGISADQLAEKIGKSRATIYRYENEDIKNLPSSILETLAIALSTTPAYLMGWEESETNDELKSICNRIKTLIESNNISYGELSNITGIPKSALHRYATGETLKIPLDRVKSIANAFSVSASWIMGWEESETKEPTEKKTGANLNDSPLSEAQRRLVEKILADTALSDEEAEKITDYVDFVKSKRN